MMSMALAQSGLKGREKAAILLVALGPDLSAGVLKHLDEDKVEFLTREVLRLERVPNEVQRQVLDECYQSAVGGNVPALGGASYVHAMLSKAFGGEKADDMFSRLQLTFRHSPFDFLKNSDPYQLVNFIQGEQPQTIALILSHLKPNHAAKILSALDDDLKVEVATKIATMDRTAPEVVEQVESVLKKKVSLVTDVDYSSVGGAKYLAKILGSVDRSVERVILSRLDENNPDLAVEVRKLIFVFEDIAKLDDRSIQVVLREVDNRDLALALRGCSEELKDKIFKNLSTRAADMLKEEIESMGPVRLQSVDEAQQRIVAVVRRLDESEEIHILRGADDVLL